MQEILEALCEYYNVTPEFIFHPSREGPRVKIRQMFIEMSASASSKNTHVTISLFMTQFGDHFFDRATNINSIKRVREKKEIYPSFRQEYNEVKDQVKNWLMPMIVVKEVNLLAMCARTF